MGFGGRSTASAPKAGRAFPKGSKEPEAYEAGRREAEALSARREKLQDKAKKPYLDEIYQYDQDELMNEQNIESEDSEILINENEEPGLPRDDDRNIEEGLAQLVKDNAKFRPPADL